MTRQHLPDVAAAQRAASCTGKQRHPTKPEALKHLRHLLRRGKAERGINVYPCRHCGGFHIGTSLTPTRQRKDPK